MNAPNARPNGPGPASLGTITRSRVVDDSTQQSTDRGGAGTFHTSLRGREDTEPGPEDYSDTRGRDLIPARDPDVVCHLLLLLRHKLTQPETKVTLTGRGGVENIRSPSSETIREENGTLEKPLIRSELRGYDRDLIATIDDAHDTGVVRQV